MRLLDLQVLAYLVLLIKTPVVGRQRDYLFSATGKAQNQAFLVNYRQFQFDRLLQDASPPSSDKDAPFVQPDGGGNHHGGRVENHRGIDLQAWDKQHPRPPPP
ncbi:hypothetical protein IFM89_007145 [Coptis chinensis]|uniref:Secreted protein n=1 Tax=Coptis chinensis TaxID=261450 RepID=A0A835LKR2_9MAGN|nr:hypothetical protein IFM89_007145 [Coptis chinensis]